MDLLCFFLWIMDFAKTGQIGTRWNFLLKSGNHGYFGIFIDIWDLQNFFADLAKPNHPLPYKRIILLICTQ